MKRFKHILLGLVVTCSLFTSALAAESMPLEDAQLDAGYETTTKSNSGITPRMSDTMKLLHSYTLTGLNPDKYYYQNREYAGYEFPKQVGYVSTRLTTTGYYDTVRVGFGKMGWGSGSLTPIAYTNNDLRENNYVYFDTYSSSENYVPFITNTTGGVLKGTVKWCSLLD